MKEDGAAQLAGDGQDSQEPGRVRLTFFHDAAPQLREEVSGLFDEVLEAEERGDPERIMALYSRGAAFSLDGRRIEEEELRRHVETGCAQEGRFQINYDCHLSQGIGCLRARGFGRQFVNGALVGSAWVSLYLVREGGGWRILRQDVHSIAGDDAGWREKLAALRDGGPDANGGNA